MRRRLAVMYIGIERSRTKVIVLLPTVASAILLQEAEEELPGEEGSTRFGQRNDRSDHVYDSIEELITMPWSIST